MRRSLLLMSGLLIMLTGYTQKINLDYKAGAVNVALPKTPESQAFEKYGNIPVNEVTGTANLSIPLYNIKSRFLSLPVTLSCNTSGIKVNQEASWVGLGFDLVAGGRITVDVKGCIDNDGVSQALLSPSLVASGMQKIFNRLSGYIDHTVLTYSGTCQLCDPNDPGIDTWSSVNAMALYGLGEPDIFHANFPGYSVSFYYDKVSGQIKFLGEKSLVTITSNKDQYQRITDWTVTDNMGVKYYFTQKEQTDLSMPSYGGLFGTSSTSAWLLTKMVHPTGDSIVLSYSNYGNSYPAFTWSASVNGNSGQSNDANQNYVVQHPMVLTRIESADVAVDFVSGSRNDIKGAGSRKLDEIRVTDKENNSVKKKISFSYDYFNCSQPTCYAANLPDSVKSYSLLRLKLNQLFTDDPANKTAPYKFYYYGSTVPDKYTFSQDHWGFYNGAVNAYVSPQCSPQNLIPHFTDELQGIAGGSDDFAAYYSFINQYPNYNANRNCSPSLMPVMTMDSIVYPTGGSTKLIFEPHSDDIGLTGGGLRIKTIRNYSLGKFAGSTDYTYSNGIYGGNIRYQTISYSMQPCLQYPGPDKVLGTVSSNGYMSNNDYIIAYENVVQAQKNSLGETNGYVSKQFRIPTNTEFVSIGAHWPSGANFNNTTLTLFPPQAAFPKQDYHVLDGKLVKEEYYSATNNLLKSINYYYHRAESAKSFYSIRAVDNRIGGAEASGWCPDGYANNEFLHNGARRYTILVSPAESYYTLTDSVVEKNYSGSQVLVNKKSYQYNSFYQPEYEAVDNGDGTQTITYTKSIAGISDAAINYPLSSNDPVTYDLIYNLRMKHVLDLPIEQLLLRRNVNGDTAMLAGRFTYYKPNTQAYKTFAMENSSPVSWRSQFVPAYLYSYGGANTLTIDNNYKFQDSAIYNASSLVSDLVARKGNSTYIWDDYHNHLLAQVINAGSGDVAFTSFESTAKGNWSYTGASATDNSSLTGTKYYPLSGGSISKSGLNSSGSYTVSYWSRNGQQSVSNSASVITGRTTGNWTYFEHQVNNPVGGSITVSGTGSIDELRLYPSGALMNSYVYQPLIGISSQCDANNKISYYEYDGSGRLALIRDQDKNILKKYCYNFAGQQEDCTSPCTNTTANWQNTTTALRCQLNGASQNTGYQEQEQKDNNICSPTYNQTRWVVTVYNTTACPLPAACNNTNCTGNDKKCINGVCETGVWKVISSIRQSKNGPWTCTYAYCFSDGSTSTYTQDVTSSTMCPITCF